MDKEWMSKNRLSKEYVEGVESFLNFAIENTEDKNDIFCPCVWCGNLRKQDVETIRAHLTMYGIALTYRNWILHGERYRSETVDKDEKSSNNFGFYRHEMIDMVQDMNVDPPIHFQTLVGDAEMPLYPECAKFTKLSATVKLYNLKAKYGWSDTSFTDLLQLIREMLPEDNVLPSSLYEAKKSLSMLGMKYEKIHACPKDCMLYRKEHANLVNCPTCGKSRWKVGKNGRINEGVPAKVLWYFPPIPRFQRMFNSKDMSNNLTWHAHKRISDGNLRHPADSPSWKRVDEQWPSFGNEPRNLRLALSADGINPHSNLSSKYSCWPIILVIYNLPPWLVVKRKHMMLTLLVSGPHQPGNDIDVYLAPLIDDLKQLWEVGVETYDAFKKQKFMLRDALLWTINDFPAYGNLSGCKVKGYLACPICGDETHARCLKHSRKISYTGHRKFLPRHHPYRRQKKAFNGKSELRDAPNILSGIEVFERVQNIPCGWGKKDKKAQSKGDDNKNPWKKRSIFFELEYWKHLLVRHCLDVMHIEKNVCESLFGTLLNIPGKTKDGVKARLDLVDMGLRDELAPEVNEKRTYLPPACYSLSKEEKRRVYDFFSKVKVPTGYSSNVSSLLSTDASKLVGLKSHDCHILMQQFLPVAIRGMLPDQVRRNITRLCFFFKALCSKVIDVSKLDDIQRDITVTLCVLEKHFPPAFFDIMVHLTVHLVREVKLCGPVWYRWMYPFERFMSVLKGYVRNRNCPEGCIAECYIAEEALEYCSEYLSSVHTVGLPSTHHQVNLTRCLSAPIVTPISEKEWEQAHLYVLTNEEVVSQYIEEHLEHLKNMSTRKRSDKLVQDEHNRKFIPWLQKRVATACLDCTQEVPERLKWLARGPNSRVLKYDAYMINGVTFHTKARDSMRTVQNSGVTLVAKTMQVASAKDNNPIVCDMTFYGVIDEIWELDYTSFQEVVFKCIFVEHNSGIKVEELGFTLVNLNRIGFKDDSFILGKQAKQVFYVEDPQDCAWSVMLQHPSVAYTEEIEEDIIDLAIHLDNDNDIDVNNENDQSCIRRDCIGTWVDNDASL